MFIKGLHEVVSSEARAGGAGGVSGAGAAGAAGAADASHAPEHVDTEVVAK